MRVFVILPAAGLGTRMTPGHSPSAAPKQFLELRGVPILIHTLRAFASVPQVTEIYVAVRASEMERLRAQAHEYGVAEKVRFVEGGEHRQQSVANAFKAMTAGDKATQAAILPALQAQFNGLLPYEIRPEICNANHINAYTDYQFFQLSTLRAQGVDTGFPANLPLVKQPNLNHSALAYTVKLTFSGQIP